MTFGLLSTVKDPW